MYKSREASPGKSYTVSRVAHRSPHGGGAARCLHCISGISEASWLSASRDNCLHCFGHKTYSPCILGSFSSVLRGKRVHRNPNFLTTALPASSAPCPLQQHLPLHVRCAFRISSISSSEMCSSILARKCSSWKWGGVKGCTTQ